jgi:hypothetical protein
LEKERSINTVNYQPACVQILEQFGGEILNKFLGGVKVSGCRTLTLDEALGSFENLAPFDPTTSTGIRLKIWKLSKKDILARGNDYPVFVAKHRKIMENMENGVFEYQVNADKLKDELRDHERVQEKKTRVFKITDFVDNVVIKQAVGHLVSKTKDLHWMSPNSVGIDPGGPEWRVVAEEFVGEDVIESDIKGMDSTVTSMCYTFFWMLFSIAYNQQFARKLACYAVLSIINSLRFNRGFGFLRGFQNTSGNWITTWLNTIVNFLYFSIAVIYGAIQNGEDPRVAYRALKIKLYSDDNLTALRRSWYNPSFLAETFMKLFNVTLTSVSKGSELLSGPITGATFLSRGFRFDSGQWFCPLAYDSLMAQLYFLRVPKRFRGDYQFLLTQLQQNLDNVARELEEYPYPEAFSIAVKIVNFITHHELPLNFPFKYDSDRVLMKLTSQ